MALMRLLIKNPKAMIITSMQPFLCALLAAILGHGWSQHSEPLRLLFNSQVRTRERMRETCSFY